MYIYANLIVNRPYQSGDCFCHRCHQPIVRTEKHVEHVGDMVSFKCPCGVHTDIPPMLSVPHFYAQKRPGNSQDCRDWNCEHDPCPGCPFYCQHVWEDVCDTETREPAGRMCMMCGSLRP